MSVKKHLTGLTALITGTGSEAAGKEVPRPRGSGSVGAPVELAQFSAGYQRMERELTDLKGRVGRPLMVPLDLIDTSPFQNGELDKERVARLVANLKENPLNTPIVVRKTAAGNRYELIAGHHRTEAFRELQRAEIPGVLVEFSDLEARRLVFFDNLLAPEISDYAKFLGFQRLKEDEGLTLEELARVAGISKTQVEAYLSFAKLPPAALALIRAKPNAIGARLPYALAKLAIEKPDAVTEAVGLVIEGKLAATKAEEYVAGKSRTAEQRPQPVVKTINRGRKKFVEMSARGQSLVLKFVSEEDRLALEGAIEEVLRARAAQA